MRTTAGGHVVSSSYERASRRAAPAWRARLDGDGSMLSGREYGILRALLDKAGLA